VQNHDTARPGAAQQATLLSTAVEEFRAAMRQAGLTPPEDIVPGKWCRFPTNGDRDGETAGSCKLFADCQGGVFGDFRTGLKESWQARREKPSTPAERAAFRQRCEDAHRERDADGAARREEGRKRAAARWIMGTPAPDDHPYLVRKGVKSHGLRIDRFQRLLVPILDDDGVLHGLQTIGQDGEKRYLPGSDITGRYFTIGEAMDGPLCIAEGYATAATVHEATGHTVAVAFDCGNLLPAAKALRAKHPERHLIVCADDDIGVPGNPGLAKAREAADAVGALVAKPDFGEDRPADATDFNDLAALRGLDAVRECVADARAPANDEAARLASVAIYVLSGDPPTPRMRTQGDILIDIGKKVAQALFLGDDDRTYAVIRDKSEVWPVASSRFREWLRGCYYKHVGKGANANSVRDAIDTIEAEARFAGDKRKVFLRTAQADGKLYIDLTDDDWRVVEIDATGWRILGRSPVMFTRRGAPAPLPLPEHGGSLSELWPLLNVPEEARPLVAGFLLAALYPSGPYPILGLQGEEGTAKTSTALIVRSLCDPSMAPLRAPTRDEKDFLVGAIGNWCVCIDNLSGMQPWMSDALCRLSTGGSFSARTLYTDTDETIVHIQRPVILNGADVGVVRGDLVSRTIMLALGAISDDKRMDPDELALAFEKARPRIFGALLIGMAQALREKANVKLERKPRMAAFARLAVAAETALGFEAGDFMRAYESNIRDASAVVLDTPVTGAHRVHVGPSRVDRDRD
jgi:phage/plasmid primase-like uncharacterized protein